MKGSSGRVFDCIKKKHTKQVRLPKSISIYSSQIKIEMTYDVSLKMDATIIIYIASNNCPYPSLYIIFSRT
jgi:hypothetical protein